jgi:hypothetical protein
MTGKNRRPQKPEVTQAQLERAKRALKRDGTPFAGYRVWPDGRVDVLAGEPVTESSINATGPSDWDLFMESLAK